MVCFWAHQIFIALFIDDHSLMKEPTNQIQIMVIHEWHTDQISQSSLASL